LKDKRVNIPALLRDPEARARLTAPGNLRQVDAGHYTVSAPAFSYWYSTPRWTAQVTVDAADIVTFTAPILHKFVGQPRDRIRRWCERNGWPLQIAMLDRK
jgi:hypothetical protein